MDALVEMVDIKPYMDYNTFVKRFYQNEHIKECPFPKFKQYEDFMAPLLSKDPNAAIVYKNGKAVVDPELRDTENIPFTYEGGINAFIENEALTYAPDAFVDEKKTQIGYEISFTKYFYKPAPIQNIQSIIFDLEELEQATDGILADIVGGLLDEYKSL